MLQKLGKALVLWATWPDRNFTGTKNTTNSSHIFLAKSRDLLLFLTANNDQPLSTMAGKLCPQSGGCREV